MQVQRSVTIHEHSCHHGHCLSMSSSMVIHHLLMWLLRIPAISAAMSLGVSTGELHRHANPNLRAFCARHASHSISLLQLWHETR
jgi:hypothetical protein